MTAAEQTQEQLSNELTALRARVAALEQAEAERKRAEDLLRIERDLAIALGSANDLTEAFNQLLETVFQITGIDCGGVYLVDPRSGDLNLVSHRGLSRRFAEAASYLPADSPHAHLVMTGEPVYGLYAEVSPDKDETRMSEGLRALAVIPVQHKGRVVAVLNLASHTHDEVPATSRTAIEAIAAQIGGVIARAGAAAAFEENEARLRELFDEAPVGYHELDGQGRITRVNQTELEMLGYTAEEMLGRYPWEFSAEAEASRKTVLAKLRGEMPPGKAFERALRRKDGTTLPVLIEDRLLRDEQGHIAGIRSTVQDITQRKQAEEALQDERNRLQSVVDALDAMDDGVTIQDRDHNIIFQNRVLTEVFGRLGAKCYQVYEQRESVCEGCPVEMAYRDGQSHTSERVTMPSGKTVHWETTANPIRNAAGEIVACLEIGRNITERKRAEEERRELERQIQQAQKLESLGVLAGGIAHDFNNLLVGVLGNASLALMDLPPKSPTRHSIEQIELAARRAAELTNQMLAYSGKGKFVVRPLDLSKMVSEMAHLLESGISKRILLKYDFAEALPAIEADATQLRQVVMNLITNAAEAIGDESGVITLSTSVMEADRAYLAQTFFDNELPEGRYVCLEVTDTGSGMDEATRAKIFDPFFTTKFAGRGLGLAAVLGIVRGHGGAIKVYGEPGKGTTFSVLMPCSDKLAEDVETYGGQAASWFGNGTVLVVDDEESVRSLARQVLEHAGLAVITAANGREGIQAYREHADEVIAVLLDMTMPDMSGEEAFGELRRVREDVKVILSSGYNEQEVTSRFAGRDLAGFIQKPYLATSLLEKLRGLIEAE